MAKDSRKIGLQLESWCKEYLLQQGLTFIDQNYHSRYGEIDLIFLDSKAEPNTLIFVEVRYRARQDFGSGSDTVTFRKQQKIIKTAQTFLQKERKYSRYNARFDVVSVTGYENNFVTDWQANAFQANAW